MVHPTLLEGNSLSLHASGKLILFGEHSVVYGSSAIACALPKGLKGCITYRAHQQQACLYLASWGQSFYPQINADRLSKAFHIAYEFIQTLSQRSNPSLHVRQEIDRLHLSVTGPLPFKVGLGSSASLSILILKTFAKALQLNIHHEEIYRIAFNMETVFHHTPSGLDHSIALYGGIQVFQKKESLPTQSSNNHPYHFINLSLQVPEAHNNHTSMLLYPIQLPNTLHLAISWTDRIGGTAEAVQHVQQLQRKSSTAVQLIQKLGELAHNRIEHCDTSTLCDWGNAMNQAHGYLKALGLSIPKIEDYITAHKQAGALAAKLTGAGFGGSMFALYENAEQRNQAVIQLNALEIPTWSVDVP